MLYKEMPYPIVRQGHTCSVDLYIKIRNNYRLFAAKGATFTEEHCRIFSKNRTTLYIRISDNESAEDYLHSYVNDLIADPGMESGMKAEIVFSSSMRSIRQVFDGLNRRNLADLEKTSAHMVKLILSDKRIMNDLVGITSHDRSTYHHSVRVGIYATALAVHLFSGQANGHDLPALCTAFLLHDIGMTRVPSQISRKTGPLSENERQVIRKHPIWGHERLMNANYLTSQAASIVLYHHERCNGTGYPFARSGRDIPLYAKICSIADTFETLTSMAAHGSSMSPFEALSFMQQKMAGQFDPELFKAFILMLGPS
ncbi:MAG: HD domain-containing phosphohydrolase [Desulfomonilia bacterium]|jgi:HD-GYP domain-containing protein (c-di-GMP phosphodiesterase class II)